MAGQSYSRIYRSGIDGRAVIFQNIYIRYRWQQRFGSGSGSGRIRIIWSDPDPDPYQETLIWIRVAPKINQNHGINKSKWFVNVLFT